MKFARFCLVLALVCAPLVGADATPSVEPSASPLPTPPPDADSTLCFDFSKAPPKRPLRVAEPLSGGEDDFQQGTDEKTGNDWAYGHGVLPLSIQRLYDWLLDHTNWKDMSKTKLKTITEKRAGFAALHQVEVDVRVFAFIWIDWIEEWAYGLTAGTSSKPQEYVVSYQKISGTSHLKSLCGSVVLKKVKENETDAYFYEQARAGKYKARSMAEMHASNFKILRELGIQGTKRQ